eukprot:539329-Amphidinium_carterae.1
MSAGVSKVATSPARCPVGQDCSGQPSQSVLHVPVRTKYCGSARLLSEIIVNSLAAACASAKIAGSLST